jgi:Holliday junction resolvase-like predicted endonuclease
VANYLVRQGHKILERNWKTKFCEIDIISHYKGTVYFTEVKYRKNSKHGDGLAVITKQKLRQMTFAAEYYTIKHPSTRSPQLAVASVTGEDFAVQEWISLV